MRNDHLDHQNRPTYSGLSEDEKAQVRARTAEAAVFRQTLSDFNFLQALELAAHLKALKEADDGR